MQHRAKKSLGQHFLADRNICRRLVRAVNLSADDITLEIGPGQGALTQVLLTQSSRVLAVEVDETLGQLLRAKFLSQIESKQFTLLIRDILKTDLAQLLLQEHIDRKVRLFGNLPFNMATAILQHLIGFRANIEDMTFMLQREVVDRILSPPGNKQYGYLSVVVQYYCQGRKLFHLPPGVFRPMPKVSSTVVHLELRQQPAVEVTDERFFFQVVSALFAQRRKTVSNNLKRAAHQLQINEIEGRLRRAGIDPMRRAETLSLEEFARLTTQLRDQDL